MLIGLGHRARSGKDTVARHLWDRHGFFHVAFADALKKAAREIFGLDEDQVNGATKGIADQFWGMSPREIMQRLGTECLRDGFGADVWIRALRKRISPFCLRTQDVVVSDVRFINEALAIKAWGGKVRRIERALDLSVPEHRSETELEGWDGWDATIRNTGTIEDLKKSVDREVRLLREGPCSPR